MARKRDYVHERLIEDPARVKERAARNAARAKLKKAGVTVEGKEADHKDGNPRNNSLSNLRAVKPKVNNTGRGGGSRYKKGK